MTSSLLTSDILERVFHASVDCIKLLDLHGHVLMMNLGGARTMELDRPDQLVGLNWIEFWHGSERDAAREAVASAVSGQIGRCEGRAPTHKGTLKWWDSVITPVIGRDGRVDQLLVISRDVTDLHDLTAQVNLATRRNEALVKAISEVVWHSNADQTTGHSDSWANYCGPNAAGTNGRWLGLVHPDEREAVRETCRQGLAGGSAYENTYRLRHRSGAWRWVTDRVVPLKDDTGVVKEWVGLIMDIHDRVMADQALHDSEERLRLAMNASAVGIWDVDLRQGKRRWSAELKTMLGLPAEAVESEALLMQHVFPADRALIDEAHRTTFLQRSGPEPVVFRVTRADTHEVRWIRSIGYAVFDEAGRPVRRVGTWQDVTDSVAAEQKLRDAANHDPLTRLANRNLFNTDLDRAVEQANAAGALVGLLVVDLDRFKEINDTFGHAAGDLMLQMTARRMEDLGTPTATVARLGGDEFAMVVPQAESVTAMKHMADRLAATLSGPILHGAGAISGTASIGIAIAPHHGATGADLLKNADLALYAAKKQGGGQASVFDPNLKTALQNRAVVLKQARDALAHDLVAPFYQPKLSLETGAIEGFEALLRWKDDSGWRSPAEIGPAFEDPDLAAELGLRMLDRVLADRRRWSEDGLPVGCIGLNLSAAEFSHLDVAERLLTKLERHRLEPDSLEIEVTESVILGEEAANVGDALRRLHERGISIALDDFGTGFASLTHLRQYPFDWLKIDRSFIRDLGSDAGADVIVSAVIGLAHGMGRRVVAEGVETQEQLDLLRVRKCDMVQGYLIAKPMPASRVPHFLRTWAVPTGFADWTQGVLRTSAA